MLGNIKTVIFKAGGEITPVCLEVWTATGLGFNIIPPLEILQSQDSPEIKTELLRLWLASVNEFLGTGLEFKAVKAEE